MRKWVNEGNESLSENRANSWSLSGIEGNIENANVENKSFHYKTIMQILTHF